MTAKACQESWQVEAVRDGRLTGQALVRAQQHIAGCATCQREQAALAALSSQLGEMDHVDQLALRRLRQLTLAKADAAAHGDGFAATKPKRAIGKVLLLVAAGLALCGGALRFLRPTHPGGIEVVATPSAGAVWTMNRSGEVEYIDLVDGLLSVTVRHAGAKGRLVVRLPDGEVEDVGTRFRVWVSRGHVAEISVAEGSVVFRRQGEGPVSVRAGAAWRLATASNEAVSSPPAATPSVAAPPPPAAVATRSVAAPAPLLPSSSSSGSAAPVRQLEAAGGVHTEARSGARESAASVPATDREDAAYLHVVALLREHRDEEARLAAVTFLRDFPNAFRRLEVEHLIQSAGASKLR